MDMIRGLALANQRKIFMENLLKREEAAAFLGITKKTLAEWAFLKKGPPYIKLGKTPQSPVRYDPAALKAWIDSNQEAA